VLLQLRKSFYDGSRWLWPLQEVGWRNIERWGKVGKIWVLILLGPHVPLCKQKSELPHACECVICLWSARGVTLEVSVSFLAHRLTLYLFIFYFLLYANWTKDLLLWPSHPSGYKKDLEENNKSAFPIHQIIKLSKLPLFCYSFLWILQILQRSQ